MDLLESYKSIYFDLLESHYKVGDKVTCKESGMTGKVVKVDPEEEGKYYTVKREDGKSVKYAPDELKKGNGGVSKGKEEKFHSNLDKLVHKTFGPSPEEQKEGTDLFDYVLEYLIAEGYANTNEAALAIMANVVDEEAIEIIVGKEQLDETSLKKKIKAYAASRDVDADYAYGSKVHDQGDRIKKAIVKKHGEKAGENAERHAEVRNFGRGTPRAKPRIEKNRTYRTTKSGKMHGQDQSKLKRDLEYRRNERNND
jgi:hypothetical protein